MGFFWDFGIQLEKFWEKFWEKILKITEKLNSKATSDGGIYATVCPSLVNADCSPYLLSVSDAEDVIKSIKFQCGKFWAIRNRFDGVLIELKLMLNWRKTRQRAHPSDDLSGSNENNEAARVPSPSLLPP